MAGTLDEEARRQGPYPCPEPRIGRPAHESQERQCVVGVVGDGLLDRGDVKLPDLG